MLTLCIAKKQFIKFADVIKLAVGKRVVSGRSISLTADVERGQDSSAHEKVVGLSSSN